MGGGWGDDTVGAQHPLGPVTSETLQCQSSNRAKYVLQGIMRDRKSGAQKMIFQGFLNFKIFGF